MKRNVKADLMIMMVALFWGASYYLSAVGLESLDVFNLNALRFIIAFLLAAALSYRSIRSVTRETLTYSALLAVILTAVYIFATYGIKYTSVSNAGFLSSLAIIFTPILVFIIDRRVPEKKLVVVIAVSVIGIALLTLNDRLVPAVGDILCIICAVFYALHLVVTEKIVKKASVNAFHIGVFQLGFTGLFNLVFSFIIERPGLPDSMKSLAAVLFLSVFCTGIAFIVQSVAQQYTTASHVGVILTLEPVFAAVVAYIFAGEVLLPRAYFGAALLIISLLIMEINFTRSARAEAIK